MNRSRNDNTEEDMSNYLDETFNSKQLSRELSDYNSKFYFALVDDTIAGYLKINIGSAQTDLRDVNSLEIQRIYVKREFQGKKIGQSLYQEVITEARRQEVDYVWLGVWEKNIRAIKFYERNGFVQFDRQEFMLGNDKQTDIMMKVKLS